MLPNYSYFPILVESDYPISRDALTERLRESGVSARRYFYPLISEFSMYRGLPSADRAHLPVATKRSQQVICLPIYPSLSDDVVDAVIRIIAEIAQKEQ